MSCLASETRWRYSPSHYYGNAVQALSTQSPSRLSSELLLDNYESTLPSISSSIMTTDPTSSSSNDIPNRISAALARRQSNFPSDLLADLPSPLPKNVFNLADSLLTPEELKIIKIRDATELVGEIASGRLTSLEVMKAVGKRAVHAQQMVSFGLT